MKLINNLLAPLNQWLETLESRERYIVISGGIALLLVLFYLAIWDPIIANYEQQKLQHQSQQQLYSWMKNAGDEIRSLTSSGGSNFSRFKNQSISSLTDRSATTSGVKPFIEKIDQNKKGVKVKIKSASFDRIISWLADMESKYGIYASKVKIEKADKEGAVDALITLERSSQNNT